MSNPWTPGPWGVTQAYGDGCVNIMASGNELKVSGRSRRAQANRALIAAAPEMAEVLEAWIEPWNGFDDAQTARRADPATLQRINTTRALLARIRGDAP